MKSKEFHYEIKFLNKGDWTEVPENFFLLRLSDSFYPITPIIIKMLEGCEVYTPSAKFRINIRQGAEKILIPDKVPIAQTALN
jgi:hypothetical protein